MAHMDKQSPPGKTESEITRLLAAGSVRGEDLTDALFPLVYGELKGIARDRLARERPGNTLTPTALVHDAYLRLVGTGGSAWENRGHFFAAAAEAMRRILIESARRKAAARRGGNPQREPFTELPDAGAQSIDELFDLDRALSRLEEQDPGMAAAVKLRYFAGLTVEETAQALDTSPRTVNRLWTAARAWLNREIRGDAQNPG